MHSHWLSQHTKAFHNEKAIEMYHKPQKYSAMNIQAEVISFFLFEHDIAILAQYYLYFHFIY